MTTRNNQCNIHAKSCVMPKFLLTLVVLSGARCCNGFSLTRSVSSFSSFSRKGNNGSTTKLNISPYKDYGFENDEDEMMGPFFFSGEPTVDETSLGRLETLYDQPDSTTTTATEERIHRLGESFDDNKELDQDSWQ